jgi:hypothetical protein
MFIGLSLKTIHDAVHFSFYKILIQNYIIIWVAKISIVLKHFVFKDEMIPPSIPGQFIDQPVILVQIIPVMSEYYVRRN